MVHGGELGGGEAAHTVFDYSVPAQSSPPSPTSPSAISIATSGCPPPPRCGTPGSPMQLDFGEVDDHKGVLLVDAEPGAPARWSSAPGSGRRLHVLRGTLSRWRAAAEIDPRDYVRVILDEPARAGLADAVRQVMPQAVDVVLDPSRRQSPARHRSRSGRSHTELFEEYLASATPRRAGGRPVHRAAGRSPLRPERLVMEGFAPFRERTTVDFSDLELFCPHGPTGAGKSSVIDAMTFALYGCVPRYGKAAVRPVVSLGRAEAKVQLDFEVEGRCYTVVRAVRLNKRAVPSRPR